MDSGDTVQGAATCEEVPTKTAPTYCGDFFVCSICETRYSTGAVPLCHYVVRCLPRGWGSNDTEIPTCQLSNQKPEPIDGTRAQSVLVTRPSGSRRYRSPCFPGRSFSMRVLLGHATTTLASTPCFLLDPRHSSTGMASHTLGHLFPANPHCIFPAHLIALEF